MSLEITGAYRFPSPRAEWLSQMEEPIIEPDLLIVDAHHHIWQQEGNPYGVEDLAADVASGHKIAATVFVEAHYSYRPCGPQALRCVGETEQIELLANDVRRHGSPTDYCAAIVAFADLMCGEGVTAVLEAHRAASPERFRGVRQSVSRDPNFPNGIVLRPAPAGMLASSDFRAGLAALARQDLSYDAMLYHCQIPQLADAARAVPNLRIMLDHFGGVLGIGPYRGRRQEVFAQWREDIQELARCPNVSVKLGGRGLIICGEDWHERAGPPGSAELAEAWRPYVETCIEAFGVDRCLFESNFPVDKGMFSYAVVWNAFKRLAAGASAMEKAALFHDNAVRFYRIASSQGPAAKAERGLSSLSGVNLSS